MLRIALYRLIKVKECFRFDCIRVMTFRISLCNSLEKRSLSGTILLFKGKTLARFMALK
jgi:hypothetical protein